LAETEPRLRARPHHREQEQNWHT